QVWNDGLGLGHVQLAVGSHEVVLGVDVPEDNSGHTGLLAAQRPREFLGGDRTVSTGGATARRTHAQRKTVGVSRDPTTAAPLLSNRSSSAAGTGRSPPTP